MKYFVLLAMMISTNQLFAQTPGSQMTADSNFFDFLKVDPETGAPLLVRNGKSISPDARLTELKALTRELVENFARLGKKGKEAEYGKYVLTAARKVQEAGIPAGVFVGNKFVKFADPTLNSIIELEKYLGAGLKIKFNPIYMNEWVNASYRWIGDITPMKNAATSVARASKGPSKVIAGLKSFTKVALPTAIVVGGVTYFATKHAGQTSESVGSENSSVGQQRYEDNFGAAN